MRRVPLHGTESRDGSMHTVISLICLIWFIVVWLVCAIGVIQLFRYYSRKPAPAVCLTDLKEDDVPHVTIIRPVKGLEPRLYECLAATFRTTYPKSKLTISFCISSRSDPALPILLQLLHDFPEFDARLYVEDEDPLLRDDSEALGPNPKIRNMSRAYKEAKGDIVWILDCNVWVGKGVCGRLVDLLCGFGKDIKYKFVHQTPLTIDLDGQDMSSEDRNQLLGGHQSTTVDLAASTSSDPRNQARGRFRKLMQRGGGRLDEAFMSSAHAKFYNAINTVLVAPCVMGKSTMFRRSHLNYATRGTPGRSPGLDVFSDNICEDHLIGDALWKKPQPFEERGYQPAPGEHIGRWGKHGMLFGDFCFQPMSHTSVFATIDRRVRWLRVRKFTVTAATFVEPGTEAIVCSLFGAYALTSLAIFPESLVSQTWSAFAVVWLLSMSAWCLVDYIQYLLLHSTKTIEVDEHTPDFILPQRSNAPVSTSTSKTPLLNTEYRTPSLLDGRRRTFRQWWFAWFGRELSAFPIWTWAFWGGVTVEWRGRKFWVGLDMKVHEIQPK